MFLTRSAQKNLEREIISSSSSSFLSVVQSDLAHILKVTTSHYVTLFLSLCLIFSQMLIEKTTNQLLYLPFNHFNRRVIVYAYLCIYIYFNSQYWGSFEMFEKSQQKFPPKIIGGGPPVVRPETSKPLTPPPPRTMQWLW